MRQFIFGTLVLASIVGCSAETKVETVYVYLEADTVSDESADASGTDADADPLPQDITDDSSDGTGDALSSEDTDVADTTLEPEVEVGPIEEELPEPNIAPDFGNCSELGGEINIYDVQNPDCPDHFDPEPTGEPGSYVSFSDVIVSGVFSDTLFVQEQNGGPYSGVSIYTHGEFAGDLTPGDVINVSGYYYEYFGNTQVYLDTFEITSQTDPPEPYVPAHPAHLATEGVLAEMFEGVLVRVEDVTTINTKPDCPNDFGEFMVTGDCRVDNMAVTWDARLGDHFSSITGNLHFSFNNHKIEPRSDEDIQWTGKGSAGSISKCIEGDCQVPETAQSTQTIVINEVMADPALQDSNQEWIELYNTTSGTIDVNGWEIRDCADQALMLTGPDLTIPPSGYLVVGMSSNQGANGGAAVDIAYGDQFYLPNTVGSVLLFDGSGFDATLIDQMRYKAFEDWSFFKSGKSLEKKSPKLDGTQAESWGASKDEYGTAGNFGTPGAPNSL